MTANCFTADTSFYGLMERWGCDGKRARPEEALHPRGQWSDGWSYALLVEQWRSQHR